MLFSQVQQAERSQPVQSGRWFARTLGDVAEFFGVHLQTIHSWRQQGMPGVEGAWHLPTVTQWRLAKATKSNETADESERASRRKIAATKAARDELRLQRETDKLVEREAVESEVREMFSIVRARLQALPGEISAGVPNEVRGIVAEESTAKITAALKELAKNGRVE